MNRKNQSLQKNNKTSKTIKTTKFGEHLIVDAYNCNPEKLNNMEHCLFILNKLASLANMHKISEPYIVKAEGNETLGGKDPGGFSGFVIIQESHISIHTFVKRGYVTLDLYSCKEFQSDGIIEFLKDAFETEDIDIIKFERGLKYPTDNIF